MRLKIKYLVQLFFFILVFACQKFDWHNPYDPECPKELFTPSSPGASMEGNSVKLIWSQENDNISGFNIYRSAEGESITSLTQTQKSITQYLDASVTPGKKYTYYVLAVAGTNKSDTIKAEITPVFPITISTGAVTELAATSANVSGNITSAGGGTVTSRGICWATTQNPTVNNSKSTEGTGAGQYTSTITGLIAGTTYYARAYGENSRGIVYGNQVTFTTLGPPTLTTAAVSNITATSARSGGTIINDGGSPITAKGVVWSTSPNPTINLATKTNDGSGAGSFTSNMTGLISGTVYFVRAYATTQLGTSYGSDISFTTEQITISPEDITIGTQVWQSKNLDVVTYRNGDIIPQVADRNAWGQLTTGAWCWYVNNSANGTTYGRLYNWYAVNDPRGLAPAGYHIPTEEEWTTLTNFLGGASVAGGKMKSTTNWQNPNTGATNSSGFMGLPGGYRATPTEDFNQLGVVGKFWSSTGFDLSLATSLNLSNISGEISWILDTKGLGASVRCIKD